MIRLIVFIAVLTVLSSCTSAQGEFVPKVSPGAYQLDDYLGHLEGKTVACVVNQTSTIGDVHLIDTLISRGIEVSSIMTPEHGFRGTASAGEKVLHDIDQSTGIPIVSLYGSSRKPSQESLAGIDVVVFDLQDVGVRFYTYISTMTYVMEACAQAGIEMIVLDRPNPNGHYVDGPILESDYSSFVGLHEVPVVYGMTIGEYARMVKGEDWISDADSLDLKVIKIQDYDHNTPYDLPIKPSPNLPNQLSVLLYPSLCFFEGTEVSVGRGTTSPFQVIGHPLYESDFEFTPIVREGAAKPPWEGVKCFGLDFSTLNANDVRVSNKLNLVPLHLMHRELGDQIDFFNPFFDKLAGSSVLRKQLEAGMSIKDIRKSWEPGLLAFREIRAKYLLYPDFPQY